MTAEKPDGDAHRGQPAVGAEVVHVPLVEGAAQLGDLVARGPAGQGLEEGLEEGRAGQAEIGAGVRLDQMAGGDEPGGGEGGDGDPDQEPVLVGRLSAWRRLLAPRAGGGPEQDGDECPRPHQIDGQRGIAHVSVRRRQHRASGDAERGQHRDGA
jgi:hypothetical protein